MIRASAVAALLVLIHTVPATAQEAKPTDPRLVDAATRLKIVPRLTYWRPMLSGTIRITEASVDGSGTDVDVQDDLDVNARSAWQLGADLMWGRNRVRLHYEPMRFRGSAEVDDPFVFHGRTYDSGTRVFSHIDIVMYEASYDYLVLDEEHFDLRTGAGLYYWQSFSEIDAEGTDEQRTITQFVPSLSVAGDVSLNELRFGASAMLGTLGPDRQMVDLTAYAGMAIAVEAELDIGYRWLQFDFKSGTNDADLVAHGPYLALSIAF